MPASDNRIDARDWLLLVVLSVLWGGSFFFNGVVLRELPPFTTVFLRVTIAAIILLPGLWIYRLNFPEGLSGWKPFLAVALFNNVLPFSLIVTGQTYIASGLAAILNATTPLFTILVMATAGEEKLSARRIAGVIVGLAGVIILRGEDLGFASGQGLGILLCLAGAFSYGISALIARRHLADTPPLAAATFQMLASTLMMTVVAGVVERPWQLPMPGIVDMACRAGACGAVDRARLYRVLSDPAAFGSHQRHAGDAADPGDRDPARLFRARRKHLDARDCRRAGDRQRTAADRRARAQTSRAGWISTPKATP